MESHRLFSYTRHTGVSDGLEDVMKNIILTITFNTEKLDACTFHMGRQDFDVQTELTGSVG